MEPYRVWFEDAAADAFIEVSGDPKKLSGAAINNLKELLEADEHVPQTRQVIARKNLIYGFTLGLLSYLGGDSARFLVPVEGRKRVSPHCDPDTKYQVKS